VLDTCAWDAFVIETLDGVVDREPQAAAVARDYLPITGRRLAHDDLVPHAGGIAVGEAAGGRTSWWCTCDLLWM
jgi:hypothetical protein